MKRFIVFLCVTALLIAGITYYVEYLVNRPAPAWMQWVGMVVVIIVSAFYLRYLVNEFQLLLNLKKTEK